MLHSPYVTLRPPLEKKLPLTVVKCGPHLVADMIHWVYPTHRF